MLATKEKTKENHKSYQQYIYFDEQMKQAADKYANRYYRFSKRLIMHFAIEYYCSWALAKAGESLPEGWTTQGNPPIDTTYEFPKELYEKGRTTVILDEEVDDVVEKVRRMKGLSSKRRVIHLAVRAFLIEKGYLAA